MAQRTHVYEIQKGDSVLPRFIGKKVELIDYTTPEEALKAEHFQDISAIMAAAYRDRHIGSNRKVRVALSKVADGETDAQALQRAVVAGNSVKIGAATERKTPATAKPKTVVKSVGASAGSRLFERMLADPAYAQRAIDGGFADATEFEAWKVAKAAAQAPAATNGEPKVETKATAPAPAQAPTPARSTARK